MRSGSGLYPAYWADECRADREDRRNHLELRQNVEPSLLGARTEADLLRETVEGPVLNGELLHVLLQARVCLLSRRKIPRLQILSKLAEILHQGVAALCAFRGVMVVMGTLCTQALQFLLQVGVILLRCFQIA